VQGTFTPLEFVDVARVPTGRAGLHFATTPAGTSALDGKVAGGAQRVAAYRVHTGADPVLF
jgi:hypothetical protein